MISIGSLKFCSVNAAEWRKPWSALAIHFARPRVRQVALDAGGGVAVAALQPGVVLLVHDVAVHARARVGREVREALRVDEGEGADSDRDADEDGEQEEPGEPTSSPHYRRSSPTLGRWSPRRVRVRGTIDSIDKEQGTMMSKLESIKVGDTRRHLTCSVAVSLDKLAK